MFTAPTLCRASVTRWSCLLQAFAPYNARNVAVELFGYGSRTYQQYSLHQNCFGLLSSLPTFSHVKMELFTGVLAAFLLITARRVVAIEQQLELWNTMGHSMGTQFPFRDGCDKNLMHSPYRLSLKNVTATPSGSTICYDFHLLRVDEQYGCSTGDLHQLEIEAARTCKNAVANVMVNGRKAHYGWEAPPRKPTAILRVSNLGLGQITAPHAVMCFDLRAPCGVLESFCAAGGGFCQYSIYNSPKTCCSTGISSSNGHAAALTEAKKCSGFWCGWF